MLDKVTHSVVAYTHGRFTETKSSRPSIASGGVLYASNRQLLSGFIMNLQQFSLQGSDDVEMLTAVLAVALSPDDYELDVLRTGTEPVKDRLALFQISDCDVKGLAPHFRNMAKEKLKSRPLDVKLTSRQRGSFKHARDFSKQGLHIRPGFQRVSFSDDGDVVEGPHCTWASLG
ncbi:MAG: hypothetical protein AB8B83_02915 [Bdellovibrionales bacterium]